MWKKQLVAVFAGIVFILTMPLAQADWPMAGANPHRTSWTSDEVKGNLEPLWSQRLDHYISQKVQIVAANNLLYVSTSGGLYALDPTTGGQVWFYATSKPLGHSPTVDNGYAYVGCFDHKIYKIDSSGNKVWNFEAGAGFHTNPLVVNGKVYAGNRDGNFYCVSASDGAYQWHYPTGGPILFSAAYDNGVVYFASNDMHAYALNATTGSLVWQSQKLYGHGFHSWWPVVYGDDVYLAASADIQHGKEPYPINYVTARDYIFTDTTRGTLPGALGYEPGLWPTGQITCNGIKMIEYYQNHPTHRKLYNLDKATGNLGSPLPEAFLGDNEGGMRYPPIVGGDGVLYISSMYMNDPAIPGGGIIGLKPGSPHFSIISGGWKAVDEPQAYACGGDVIYWNLCWNRSAGAIDTSVPNQNTVLYPGTPGVGWTYWSYTHNADFPDAYEEGWPFAYGVHGDQNPPIPYNGRLYTHRMNEVQCLDPVGRGTISPPDLGSGTYKPASTFTMPANKLLGLTHHLELISGAWPRVFQKRTFNLFDQAYTHKTMSQRLSDMRWFGLLTIAADTAAPTSSSTTAIDSFTNRATFNINGGGELDIYMSERAPSLLAESDSDMFRLSGNIAGMAYAGSTGIQLVDGTGSFNGSNMTESWVLLWNYSAIPQPTPIFPLNGAIFEPHWLHSWTRSAAPRFNAILLSLENRPATVSLSADQLDISYSSQAGAMVVAPLYGLYDPDPRRTANWGAGVPAEVVTRARLFDQLSKAYPTGASETWGFETDGSVTIDVSYTYRDISDDWSTSPLKLAYLPPRIGLAQWGGSPIQFSGSVVDTGFLTVLGRVAGVSGTGQATITLPQLEDYWLSPLPAASAPSPGDPVGDKLADEVQKILDAGHLRIGYLASGNFDFHVAMGNTGDHLGDWFRNPGETIYILLRALPYLPAGMQADVQTYIQNEYTNYSPAEYGTVGWANGAARELFLTQPEVQARMNQIGPGIDAWWQVWADNVIRPLNFWAMALYAGEFGGAQAIYDSCWKYNQLRLPTMKYTYCFPYVLNSTIASHMGFLRLADMVGATGWDDKKLDLANMLVLRAALAKHADSLDQVGFECALGHTIDTLIDTNADAGYFNIETGGWLSAFQFTLDFANMIPPVGKFLSDYAQDSVTNMANAYEQRAPYWFVAKAEEASSEGCLQPPYDKWAYFQARTQIMQQPRSELEEYLDIPMFDRGDMYFIDNLVAILENDTGGNQAPTVDAGSDQTITLPDNDVRLDATVTDDGLPNPPAVVSVTWTKDSGPGTVTFTNANAVDTAATFSTDGVYVLRLTADDSERARFDTVTITVEPEPGQNQAPTVEAGSNQTLTLPDDDVALDGTVTDDGLPNPPAAVTVTWSKQSGAGTVTFGNANAVDTTATFSAAGVYVLRLTASDSDFSAYDELTVTVNAGGGGSVPTDYIAYYKLDETSGTVVHDESANQFNGNFVGSGDSWNANGYIDGCLEDNGSGRVDISNFSRSANAVTLSCWINTNTVDHIFQTTVLGCYVYLEKGQYRKMQFKVKLDGTTIYTIVSPDTEAEGAVAGQWIHWTGTWDGSTMRLYRNAVQVASAAQTGVLQPLTGLFRFGIPSTVQSLNGRLDEVRVYDRALSQQEITDIYNYTGGAPANQAPTVDTGSNQAITLPDDDVSLDGTVTDDGLPNPPAAVTITWTKESGPGTVDFANENAIDTTATFGTDGVYVLRLTADDSELSAYDEVTITVNPQSDTTPPTPDPLTWATTPHPMGTTSISMTATTASDASGVEYYFECTAGGGHDSGWQDSTTYEDTGLSPSTQYTYRVQVRDKSANQNATAWSTSESATTDAAPDTTPPSPDPLTWATIPHSTGTTSISMTATTASDPSGVEYYFECTAGGGHDSGWQDSTAYEDTGLSPNTQYTYRVQARDKSANQNATAWSTSQSATTDSAGGGVPTDYIAYYKLDETSGTAVHDESGNQFDGVFVGTGNSWNSNGYIDGCLADDGSGRVDISNFSRSANTVTLSCWINTNTVDSIFQTTVLGCYVYLEKGQYRKMQFKVKLDGTTIYTIVSPDTETEGAVAGQWIHWTGTWDGSTMRLYRNAVQVASAAQTGVLQPLTGLFRFGIPSTVQSLNGRLDEVRVYDRALSQQEITDIYNYTGGAPANQAPAADAGSNQTITLPDNDVALDGTVTDDGLPNPPAAVTVTWTKESGPGTVDFANENAIDTTATFSTDGVYVLRLRADDGELSAYDDVSVTVEPEPQPESVDVNNADFQIVTGEPYNVLGSGVKQYSISNVPDWTGYGADQYIHVDSNSGPLGTGDYCLSGGHEGGGVYVYQITDQAIAEGDEYTLTLDARNIWQGDYVTASLIRSDTLADIASGNADVGTGLGGGAGSWANYNLNYTIQSGDGMGQNIGVKFYFPHLGFNGWVLVDNVTLTRLPN